MYQFADTPPANAIVFKFSFSHAFIAFSINTSVTAFSKLAARSALFRSGVLCFKFITAVFIPLKLKSRFSKCVFGSCIFGFPSFANLSIFGPPGIT